MATGYQITFKIFKSLTLLYCGNSEAKIDLTLLPSSLTTLNKKYVKDRSEYKLEYLMVNANQYESLDNLIIKELDFAIDFGSNETNIINEIKKVPKGVEKLVIRHGISLSIKNIPPSVRCLEIQSLNSLIIEEEQSLPFEEPKFISSMVHKSQIQNIFEYYMTYQVDYIPKWV
ncbi:hypothetical protein PPL_12057 [Heterostelium album PN500]|uniref:Uncharacterized protein n=1 Tax=Heterostelium pallidum (strain ATCC 26659 / Pp 5 / PN500) TaxID=670386 RepID=D3BLK4_HETP5|nr:hypothetical protein PPL_12057 [Heterostelium album PN500]EFA77455.1 hypothetical protein PPL_12057 [Heterostelium album PN500]|eukprot:XP_020429583.1 hypothetical protein PPL_12057 [Heterostelium album PN500]